MNPLRHIIARMIEADGPMPFERYMALCLGHPQHGYYVTRDPFGRAGDFVTAPEVSQMFGELIGLWCATTWRMLGSPAPVNFVELGPGRGTLIVDALRAGRKVQGFAEAVRVCLVETSPVLKQAQTVRLGDRACWYDRLEAIAQGPMILVANEFFDALPVRQLERRDGRWHERCVGLDQDGRFRMGLVPVLHNAVAEEGAIVEFSAQRGAVAEDIGRRLAADRGAALIIDYGHLRSGFGDTVQALRSHEPIDPLQSPGDADITAHVDFKALVIALRSGGAVVHEPLTQREFLLAMGLEQRAAALAVQDAKQSHSAVERLAGPSQMGNLFKVIAATSPGVATPYPFGAA